MCSDGHYIYCLVRYNESHVQSKIIKIVCEIYELDHQNYNEICHLSRVGEVTLYKNDSYEPFIGRRKVIDSNYLTNGSIACNGELLVWRSRRKIHIFSLETGVRLHKELVPPNIWISTHDNLDNYFYHTSHMCSPFGLERFRIEGFKFAKDVKIEFSGLKKRRAKAVTQLA